MPAGAVLHRSATAVNAVDDVIDQARSAFAAGVRQVWVSQQFDHDAISLAGLIGAAVPGLGVGTFVVPINPRHPLVVASLAQTAQAASHGNFSLGLGLGAHGPERQAFGTTWPNTIERLREHLQVLRSITDTGEVDFHGTEFTAAPEWPVSLAGGAPLPVYVAAMGPKALRVTGELADGTFTVSNLGMFDVAEFSAIINPPEGAILAVGSVLQKPVVEDGELRVGRRMKMTISCDHRVMDGAMGARFLQDVKRLLEEPLRLLV